MLSYRHGFHAGNAADVLKHAVLMYCLDYLGQKEAPFLVIDTHSGAGRYSLTEGYAAQNREWEQGVGRLLDQAVLPPLLDRYAALVRESLGAKFSAEFPPAGRYPGSPALIQRLLRSQDRAVCFELHPADFAVLEDTLKADKRFRVLREDGLGGLKALLPPPSRRGCVFIDPSYEMKSDYEAVPEKLIEALRRFPTGLYITWYPLLARRSGAELNDDAGEGATQQEALRETLLGLYSGNRCAVELRTAAAGGGGKRLYGSGLVIYNPPFTLRKALDESLPALAELLREGQGSWDLRWEE
ncbi:23S rRNA (adenine(2030)-N(6))-methyltransferase RlmJ [Treponema primitia]|uniref:23S rRNA (adenine(2030)-N(6))-methyltransferase RlmJ n=1 Tax=Treponema primitia TaxID=88058 RepID=UPI000255530C|nr:23S rRNA (adenine(2030)-N(6))-methyltransferase RlmJ [Treponema primitia]